MENQLPNQPTDNNQLPNQSLPSPEPTLSLPSEPEAQAPTPASSIPENPPISSEYQPIINQYAANNAQTVETPSSVSPDTTVPTSNRNDYYNYSAPKKSSSLFPKILFIFSLIIFVLAVSSLGFVYYKSQSNPSSNQQVEKSQISPTPSGSCLLNDKTYLIGESFVASDGCNTCTCEAQDSISCTNNECLGANSATKSGIKNTITPTKKPTATPSASKSLE